jgi:flagellar protein FlaG
MDVNNTISVFEAPVKAPVQAAPAAAPQTTSPAVQETAPVSPSAGAQTAVSGTQAVEKDRAQAIQPSMDFIDKAIEQANRSLSMYKRQLDISVHEKTNRLIVRVMDTENMEVIREIPPERVLDAFAKTLELAGILLDTKR